MTLLPANPGTIKGAKISTAKTLPRDFAKLPLALAIASGLIASAQAQQLPQETQQPETQLETQTKSERQPEEVHVVDKQREEEPGSVKFTRPLLDTAQTVNIISQEIIEQRAATTLRDVLRNVSGISMQAGEGGAPAGDQFSIRGYSARTDIFVDNVRDFGGYTRDPFNLEQVEVVKGPSSDYSGRGSTGGSINLVSKAPSLTDSTSSSLSAGTDAFGRATVDVNHTLDGVDNAAVRVNLMAHNQDVAGRDQVSNERWGVAPSIAFGLQTDTQVTLSLFHLQQDNVPDYGIPWVPEGNVPLAEYENEPAPVDFENWYGLKDRDFENTKTSLATVQLDQVLSDSMSLRNTTRWGRTYRDSMITAPRFASSDSTDIRRSDEKYRDEEDDILSNITDLLLTLNPGAPWEHKILVGAEVSLENEKRYIQALTGSDSPATDLFNPNPNDPYLEIYQRTGGLTTADSTTLATYVSDSVQINENWQFNAGLRWDRFELEYTPDGVPMMERTDTMLSYRSGIVYKPVPQASFYLGYGTSFNPTTEALSISTSSNQPGIADLKPEENRSLELGAKWELPESGLLLSAAVFRTDKTDARTQDPDDPSDLLVLEGEQRVQGIELGVAGSLLENLNVYAGYAYLETEVLESKNLSEVGQELANSPQHSFNLWSSYKVREDLQLGLGAQFVDDRYNNIANLRTAPSYWVYEASANYAWSEKVGLQLNIQNLTDEETIDYVGGGHFIPGLGRTALVSINFKN